MAGVLLGQHDQGEGPERGGQEDEADPDELGQITLEQAVVDGERRFGEEVGRLVRLRAPHEGGGRRRVTDLDLDVGHRLGLVAGRGLVGEDVLLVDGRRHRRAHLVERLGVARGQESASSPFDDVLEPTGVEAFALEADDVGRCTGVAQGPDGVAGGADRGEVAATRHHDHAGLGVGCVGGQELGRARDPVPEDALAVGLQLADRVEDPRAVRGQGPDGHDPVGEGHDPDRNVARQALDDRGDRVADVGHDRVHRLGGVDGDDHGPARAGGGQGHDVARERALAAVVGDDGAGQVALVALVGNGQAHDVAAGRVDATDGQVRRGGLVVGREGDGRAGQDGRGEQAAEGGAQDPHRAEPIIWCPPEGSGWKTSGPRRMPRSWSFSVNLGRTPVALRWPRNLPRSSTPAP